MLIVLKLPLRNENQIPVLAVFVEHTYKTQATCTGFELVKQN